MKGLHLDKYQTRGESRDEGHHGERYRGSERHALTYSVFSEIHLPCVPRDGVGNFATFIWYGIAINTTYRESPAPTEKLMPVDSLQKQAGD
jgi:hypothetical protein